MNIDITILSLVLLTVINGYWTWQGKKVQNDRDIIKALQLQLKLKDEAIAQMLEKKNAIKAQFQHQHARIEKLEGQLAAYQRFHNHSEIDKV